MNNKQVAQKLLKIAKQLIGTQRRARGLQKIAHIEHEPRGFYFVLTWRFALGNYMMVDYVVDAIEKTKREYEKDMRLISRYGSFSPTRWSGALKSSGRGAVVEFSVDAKLLKMTTDQKDEFVVSLSNMDFEWR